MIETNSNSTHLAGIIPLAGQPLGYNMPWADHLIPIHDNYHAVERAVHTAAMAGCNTIWIVMHREAQPVIRKKLGEWVYDPESIWKPPDVFLNKIEVPVYYVSVNPRDRKRRDSLAWSCLYGAKVSSYISMKISKWVIPKRFLVVSPYGVIDEDTMKNSRQLLRGTSNVAYVKDGKSFLDNIHLPFTFSQDEYENCKALFKERYSGDETRKTFGEVFEAVDIKTYNQIDSGWFYDISSWDKYSKFIGSHHNSLCKRPGHLVTHKWWGFVKDR